MKKQSSVTHFAVFILFLMFNANLDCMHQWHYQASWHKFTQHSWHTQETLHASSAEANV